MLCFRGEKQVQSALRCASQTIEHRGALIAFHMEIKTKRRRTAVPHSQKTTYMPANPAESRIVFFCFPRFAENTNSFSQFQPTAIRLSTSVFVKLKGLYSQRRAARRNFPLLVFPLDFLYGHCARNQSRSDNRICCKHHLCANLSAQSAQKSQQNAV